MDRADLEQWRPRDVARLLALVEAQRSYFQQIVAGLPVGVLVLSAEMQIVLANNTARKLLKLPEQRALTFTLNTVLPAWVLGRVEQVLKAGGSEPNIPVDLSSGRRLQIGIVAIPGWDEEGGPEVLLTIEDMGARGTAAEVAGTRGQVPVRGGKSTPSTLELVEDLAAVLWAVDPRTMRPIFVSPQAEQLLGFPPEFWIGNPSFWTDRVHPGDRDRVTEFYRRAVKNGQERACEFRSVRADGQVIWLRETVRVVADSAGRSMYLAGVTVDVTERRLIEQQLIQRERIDAIQKLSSRMAHDLNNMLMILEGNAEEVLNGLPATSELRGEVEAIVSAAQRMVGLTGHLLAFTRRTPIAAEVVELEPVLSALGEQQRIERRGPLSRSRVTANVAQLEQVLTSVIAAARKAARPSGAIAFQVSNVEIREELQRSNGPLDPANYTAITIGAPDARSEGHPGEGVFERFLPEKDAADDTGSRLAQAYSVVRQWGGDIAVAEEGAIFRVFLRRVGGGADTAERSGIVSTAPAAERRVATILVVEDEAGIRALVRKFLGKQGYEVLEASNGEEALGVIQEYRGAIDLLITDMIMPHMGGRQLVDRLQEQGRDLKILYISGYTDDSTVYAAELPPGNAFLQKPFTLSALVEKVRGLLG